MKHLFKFAIALSTAMSARTALAESPPSPEPARREIDLNVVEQLGLEAKLAWAKIYLAELEKNDTAMSQLGLPVEVSPKRTTYALYATATHAGLIAATYYALVKPLQHRQRISLADPYMERPLVKLLRTTILNNELEISTIKRRQRIALPHLDDPSSLLPNAKPSLNVATNAERVASLQKSLKLERMDLRRHRVKAGRRFLVDAGRGALIGMGIGYGLSLIWDAGVAYLQVAHNGAHVEAQKANLRDIIADAEHRLANNAR